MRHSLWVCLVLVLSLAAAAAPAPAQAAADAAASNCSLGITNGGGSDLIAFSAFSVFLYLDPAQCATCTAPGVVQITQVHVPYCGANNNVRFTVTPVAAVSDPVNPGLLRPDASHSLGPSVTFDGTLICVGGFVFRTLSLPSPVSIDRPCYVRVSLRTPDVAARPSVDDSVRRLQLSPRFFLHLLAGGGADPSLVRAVQRRRAVVVHLDLRIGRPRSNQRLGTAQDPLPLIARSPDPFQERSSGRRTIEILCHPGGARCVDSSPPWSCSALFLVQFDRSPPTPRATARSAS